MLDTIVGYSTIPYNELPDPKVAFNEYPNPSWNTTRYEWDAEYSVCTPEWFAQQTAKTALKCGLQYGTRNRAQEQRDNLERYLIARGDKMPTPKKEAPSMQQTGLPDSKNGVLTDTHLYRYINGKIIKTPCDGNALCSVSDILQVALNYNLRTVWDLAGTELSKRATADFIVCSGDWQFKGNPQMTKGTRKHIPHCKFVAGYQEGQRAVYVGFLEYNTDWGLQKQESPVIALAALTYIEDALGVAVTYSAGSTGVYLMKKVNNKQRVDWIEKIDIRKIPPIRDKQVCVAALDWKTDLTEEEITSGGYVVSYDKNMAHTATCTGVKLGSGEPVHERNPQFKCSDSTPAGIWYCKISGISEFDGKQLPHPADGKTEGWFYTYTVKLLHELGYDVGITEAWIWKDCHTILRPFANKIFDAKSALDDNLSPDTDRYKNAEARKIAAADIKFIANKSMGWTRMSKNMSEDSTEELDWYIRPDWDDLIVDYTRYQVFWRVRTMKDAGYFPVGIHADCIYYIALTPDHWEAIPHMMERKNPKTKEYEPADKKLGGYKPHFQTVITIEEAAPVFVRNKVMSTANTELADIDKRHLEEQY